MRWTLSLLTLFTCHLFLVAEISRPYIGYHFATYEERSEANGYAVTYGDSLWGASIGLDQTTPKQGDSSVVGYVTRQNDTDNQSSGGYLPHRAYAIPRFFGNRLGDTTNTRPIGKKMECPCWIQFWHKFYNLTLRSRGVGKIDDWYSPLTICWDSTDSCNTPVTLGMDSSGYIYTQHVPTDGLATHIYQATAANDPLGKRKMVALRWDLIQVFYDPRVTGRITSWVNGRMTSLANVTRGNYIMQVHAGLYASAAVSVGTVWNDDMIVVPVKDSADGVFRFMSLPPGR